MPDKIAEAIAEALKSLAKAQKANNINDCKDWNAYAIADLADTVKELKTKDEN